jgi:hypothetical protein
MLPEMVSVFRQASSSCESLRSSVLFLNSERDRITVRRVLVSTESFEVRALALPITLDSEASLVVQIAYRGEKATETARVSIGTDKGCSEFAVRGISTSEALSTRSHYAVDFGALSFGATKRTETVLIRYQKGVGPALQSWMSGFGAGPNPPFELLASPTAPVELTADCATQPIEIAFNAPREPGLHRGELAWEVFTDTSAGRLVGDVYVSLIGRSQP